MLLTLTTTHSPATDLGYLLHKHPRKLQTFPLAFGQAHIFYPEATNERCTASLLLDIDPIQLFRSRRGAINSHARFAGAFALQQDDADLEFHRLEFERLTLRLEEAMQASQLPEAPVTRDAVNNLLVRIRLS